jgi:hypothetical protein
LFHGVGVNWTISTCTTITLLNKGRFQKVPEAKEDHESVLKEKAVSETKKDVKTVLVLEALDNPETVLKESSASETKKYTETTPEANEETYTEPDDDVTKAAKEDNLSQSGGSLPWGLIRFGGNKHPDVESQS